MAENLNKNNTINESNELSDEYKELAKFWGNIGTDILNYVRLYCDLIDTCGLIAFSKSVIEKEEQKSIDKAFYKYLYSDLEMDTDKYTGFYLDLITELERSAYLRDVREGSGVFREGRQAADTGKDAVPLQAGV